ncbi:NAD(P)/FAD-dependent oxidoreductase [Catellatospora bangladeshensis]|uniref:NADH dehydrogenase n=1 Tax=Catellatospora bangladeshensis TaxID=310355 RepID=A0A8J3JNG5_9ACTN|nr:NAD(P)/FAD-dependent oxidoreductase [Catellatospora bangladeshensis]GIF80334.1 NADH dehydrogenase [Catellatospora bangladeshensis]
MSADVNVVIVGGGLAGVACAKRLAGKPGMRVELIDRAGFQQFQPLLYQVATAELTSKDVRFDLDRLFRHHPSVNVRKDDVTAIDPGAMTVTLASGDTLTADHLVLAAGAQPNFFETPGAREHAFPLYSVEDALRVRGRVLTVFQDVAANPALVDEGALNFVIVGGGPTGVETSGALAELVHDVMPGVHHDVPCAEAQIILVDGGPTLLSAFSHESGDYAARQLKHRGVLLHLGTRVQEVTPESVTLADGTVIKTRLVVWGGGEKAADIAAASGLTAGHGGRIQVEPDLSVAGHPHVYAIGDVANIPYGDEAALPQLGSVAQQSGRWVADNIVAQSRGEAPQPFHYRDKGIMAMIGTKAAVAEIGPHRHEIHGRFAFAAWLGVHLELLSDMGSKIHSYVTWAEEFYLRPNHRSAKLLDPTRIDTPAINWDEDS